MVSNSGIGHQYKAELKKAIDTKRTLEAERMALGNAPLFSALAASLDKAISEAVNLAYAIEETLNAND